MKVHSIQTGEVQIKSRHVEARFGPRGNHPTVVAPTHDPMTDKRLTEGATSPSAEARA